MIISVNSGFLEIEYVPKTDRTTFSISDVVGKVLLHGNYKLPDSKKIAINHLKNGTYFFSIIDGDLLLKTRFLKH